MMDVSRRTVLKARSDKERYRQEQRDELVEDRAPHGSEERRQAYEPVR